MAWKELVVAYQASAGKQQHPGRGHYSRYLQILRRRELAPAAVIWLRLRPGQSEGGSNFTSGAQILQPRNQQFVHFLLGEEFPDLAA